jgi:hypothetical protein
VRAIMGWGSADIGCRAGCIPDPRQGFASETLSAKLDSGRDYHQPNAMTRLMLALVCIFTLPGCSPRQESNDPETTARGDEDKDQRELIAVEELGWGYMQARHGAEGDQGRLFPTRTPADYEDFALAMSDDGYLELSQHFPRPPSFDPATEVLIFVELPDDAGTELRPAVEGIEREGAHARVLAYRTKNPPGAKTDEVSRAWILIRAPKRALEGDPGLSLELAEGVR